MYSRVFFGVEQEIVNNTNIIPLKKKNCRNKPEGRKTALAGASLFTSHLLEIQTWTCLLPVLIRNLFSKDILAEFVSSWEDILNWIESIEPSQCRKNGVCVS